MNKKGFSLVELLAVIVILALITVIGVSSYRNISEKVRETSYKNKISLIETKAVEYANGTGFLVTNVDELVKEGYLAADDEAGHVTDPRNTAEYLNCHVVSMTNENNMIYASYSEEYTDCDVNNLDRVNRFLEIQIYKNGTRERVESGTWIKENARLEAHFKEEIDSSKITNVVWSNSSGVIKQGRELSITTNVQKILDSYYSVEITMENGQVYYAQTRVKIDKVNPNIVNVSLENENEKYTSKSKKVKVIADDQGSGVFGYAIEKEKRRCTEVRYEEVKANQYSKEIAEEGTYYVCVKDKVGNVTEEAKAFEVKGIDTTSPSCELEASGTRGENDWYTSDVEIRFKSVNDDKSGIATSFIDKAKITYDTEGELVTGTVVDKAGNSGTCSIQVKVDKTSPSCELEARGTKGANGWYTSNVDISIKEQRDTMSGIASSSLSRNQITENTYGVNIVGTVVDNAGNSGTCTIQVKKDSQKPVLKVKDAKLIIDRNNTQYDTSFNDNLEVSFGISGKGVVCSAEIVGGSSVACMNGILCNPAMSQKKNGYPVSCIARGGNGLESEPASFQVYHGYVAPVNDSECSVDCGSLHPNGETNDNGDPLGTCECPWGEIYYNQTNCWVSKVPCDAYFCYNDDLLEGNICYYTE